MSYSDTPSISAHDGVDVPRHGEVDQQHRPPVARAHHLRELARLEQQMRRGGRGDDDVGALERLGQLVEADAAPAVALARG